MPKVEDKGQMFVWGKGKVKQSMEEKNISWVKKTTSKHKSQTKKALAIIIIDWHETKEK